LVEQQREVEAAMGVFLGEFARLNISWAYVDLEDLQCTKEEAMNMVRGEERPTGRSSQKSRTRINVMKLFSKTTQDFLIRCTYPCLIVTSPAVQCGERNMVVVPRSIRTRRGRSTQCIFLAEQIARAVVAFIQEVLYTTPDRKVTLLDDPAFASWLIL
jgi:hypothetical protein